MRVVTSDLREAIAAVSQVYCPHDVTVLESNRGIAFSIHPELRADGSSACATPLRSDDPVELSRARP